MSRRLVGLLAFLLVVAFAWPAEAQLITTIADRNRDADAPEAPQIAPNPLDEGSVVFVDRTHVYKDVPLSLVGAEYIILANDNKNHGIYELDVTVSKNATIYVFVDNRMGGAAGGKGVAPIITGMPWLTQMGFVDNGEDIGIDENADGSINQYYSVFARAVAAGTYTLGGCTQGHTGNMLGVAVGGEPPVKATKPNPADGATGVPVMQVFTWTKGVTAVIHKIYFGTAPDALTAVNNPLGAMNTQFMPVLLNLVEPGVTYYWRVDEVEKDGVTTHTGDVWSFTTASVTAWQPVPPDGSEFVDPNTNLSWKPGEGAYSHDLYFGTDKTAVESGDAAVLLGNNFLPEWELPLLEDGTTYYWRIDGVKLDESRVPGEVWSFTTIPPIEVSDPSLLAWYKMDEEGGSTVVDWSGNGHHATFASPAPVWAMGQFGSAIECMGTGQHAVCPDGTFMNGLDAVTITAWVKSDVVNTDKGFLIFADPAGNDNQDMRYDAAGSTGGGVNLLKLGLSVATDPNTTTIVQLESSNDSQTTEWQHLAMVWSSGQAIQLYINGNLDVPTSVSAAATGTLTGFNNVIIGKAGKDNSSTLSWDGLIDEIRIYDKALTEAEIELIMRGDPMLAWDPNPANGALTDELHALPMTWQAGDKASRHDVYLGTNRAAVAAADTSDTTGIYRGTRNVTSFTPAEQLEWGAQYFWRVDEINTDGSVTKGFVWAFTLTNYLDVDDFEIYTNYSPLRVFQIWNDGWGFSADEFYPNGSNGNGTGGEVGYDPTVSDIMETTIIHGGRQSVRFKYRNAESPYYSEMDRTWATPQPWSMGGVTHLSLWAYGYPAMKTVPVTETAGKMTLTGSGSDIWGTNDQFTFACKTLNGNGTMVARVVSIGPGTNTWAKGGVMVRESLNGNSTHAMMVLSANTDGAAGNGASFQRRLVTGGASTSTHALSPVAAPYWVKIERTGDTLTGYISRDGNDWIIRDAVEIVMTDPVYIGLCVTSHAAGENRTYEFDNIKSTGGVSGAWQGVIVDSPKYNPPAVTYVTLKDSTGKSFTLTDPNTAKVNIAGWRQWTYPLSGFVGVDRAKIKTMAIGVGDKSPDGTGELFIDDIQVIKLEP